MSEAAKRQGRKADILKSLKSRREAQGALQAAGRGRSRDPRKALRSREAELGLLPYFTA